MVERAQFGPQGLGSYPGSGNYQLNSFTQHRSMEYIPGTGTDTKMNLTII